MSTDGTDNEDFAGCLAGNLRAASRILTRIYDTRLRDVGLRVTQLAVLAQVRRLQPVSVTDLARQLASERSGVTRDLRVLEREGLIVIGSGDDARTRAIRLTDQGCRLLTEAAEPWRRTQAEVAASLGPEFDKLLDASRSLVVLLEDGR